MKAKRKRFSVVCLHDDWGYDEETYPVLRDLVERSEPDYWEFHNPGSLTAYFRENRSRRAELLVNSTRELIATDSRFRNVGVGTTQGDFIAVFGLFGQVKSAPIGTAIGEAASLGVTSVSTPSTAPGQ